MADPFAERHITGCATEELKAVRFEPEPSAITQKRP